MFELADRSPVLLVFLRHTGCTFCREALSDIAAARQIIEGNGIFVVLVYTDSRPRADKLLARYGLGDVESICDPAREMYRAFGLKRGSFQQLFGLRALWRAFAEGVLVRYGFGAPLTDPAQMPGLFRLLEKNQIVRAFRHRSVSDRPDYSRFCGLMAAAEM